MILGRRQNPFMIARQPFVDPPSRHDLGRMEHECQHCKALHWHDERVYRAGEGWSYGMCCSHGQVRLPSIPEPPPNIKALFEGSHRLSAVFRNNVRQYNAALAFTSMGVQVDEAINQTGGRAPYVFRIHGRLHHQVGSLIPSSADRPKVYAQLYILDTRDALESRMTRNRNLDRELMEILQEEITQHHCYAERFKHAHEVLAATPDAENLSVRLAVDIRQDPRCYNAPTADKVAVVLPGDGTQRPGKRDIVLHLRDGILRNISEGHPAYACLHYILLFPFGTHGYHWDLKLYQPQNANPKRLTMTRYHAYHLFNRTGSLNVVLRGGRLFQEYLVDAWASAEQNRLEWLLQNQNEIRASLYSGLVDHIHENNDVDLNQLGERKILPSSHTGSPRYMGQLFQDALAIGRQYQKIDLFITMTANPAWPEIVRELQPGETAADRPDLTTRVFALKKQALLDDTLKHGIFGQTVAHIYTIEFQKRGLPHMHLLIFLSNEHKIRTPADVDSCIRADFPDPVTEPKLFETVKRCMVHGPCGAENPAASCMKDGKCTKGYPKPFCEETTLQEDGRPAYRRPNDGRRYGAGNHFVDNRNVVLYNAYLSAKFDCHINVETCVSFATLKYVTKYIHKGPDRATVEVFRGDEIKTFLDSRYVSSCEAAFRTFHFALHEHNPTVVRLPVCSFICLTLHKQPDCLPGTSSRTALGFVQPRRRCARTS
jgi:hypothetical protein